MSTGKPITQSCNKREKTSANSILTLPEELLEKIFFSLGTEYVLSEAAYVCSRFWRSSLNPFLKREIVFPFHDPEYIVPPDNLPMLIAQLLVKLELASKVITQKLLDDLAILSPGLHSLNLRFCYISEPISWEQFSKKCYQLKDLYVTGSDQFSRENLACIANWKNLETILISNCENFDDTVLKDVVRRCPNLKSVNLSCNKNITDDSVELLLKLRSKQLIMLSLSLVNLTQKSLVNIGSCVNLEELHLSFEKRSAMEINIYFHKLQKLKNLSISSCTSTTKRIAEWFKYLPNLVEFHFYACYSLDESTSTAISKYCPLFETLDLNVTLRNFEKYIPIIQTLVRRCENFKNLRLSFELFTKLLSEHTDLFHELEKVYIDIELEIVIPQFKLLLKTVPYIRTFYSTNWSEWTEYRLH